MNNRAKKKKKNCVSCGPSPCKPMRDTCTICWSAAPDWVLKRFLLIERQICN